MKYTIQFIADDRILIRGTSGVSVRGQILIIGVGETGEKFTYLSPEDQVAQFGHQAYVLLSAEDEQGNAIDHPDINRSLNGPAFIDPVLAASWPQGVHEYMKKELGEVVDVAPSTVADVDEDDEEDDEAEVEERPKPKRKAKLSKKK